MCSVTIVKPAQTVLATAGLEEQSFIEQLVEDSQRYQGANRRQYRRYTLGIAVRAFQVNDSMENLREEYVGVTRDISLSGAAIYFTQAISERVLALEFATPSGESNRTLMQVLRCRPVGPLFEIAGRFLS